VTAATAGRWRRSRRWRPGRTSDPAGSSSVLVVHPGAELYGADRMLVESVSSLSAAFDVTVALPHAGPLVAELERLGVRVVLCPMPVLRNAALRPGGAVRLVVDAVRGALPALRLLRRHATGGVYVNTLTLPSWPLLAKLAGRPSLCHVHEAEQSAPRLLRKGMALCPAMSDRVVANSRFTLDVLADVAPAVRDRSAVIHNAVRAPGRAAPARPQLQGPLQLLYVGRLSPRKGPQVALAVLQELLARGVAADLTLVGEVFRGYEWFEAELRGQVATAELEAHVHFAGFRSDVWPYLERSDVVLVPSVGEESFGNTAVEAVLAARPLVVSATSGLLEATAGYESTQAVPPGRPDDWADAVERAVADWSRYRSAARDDAAEAHRRHHPARFGERLVEEMASLTATAHAARPQEPGRRADPTRSSR
jgi:glycosyltransferase involved in cell wall biosynthesis